MSRYTTQVASIQRWNEVKGSPVVALTVAVIGNLPARVTDRARAAILNAAIKEANRHGVSGADWEEVSYRKGYEGNKERHLVTFSPRGSHLI